MTYWPERLRVLASYAYQPAIEAALEGGADLLVDSGAFTAFTLGEVIRLEEYADFLLERAQGITVAVTLDVIGDWRGTAENLDKLRDRVGDAVPIMPVWHSGSPESELRRLCREHDYIAVGGVTTMASQVDKFMRHMIHAHRIAAETGTKLHGLGVTGERALLDLPWYTVDSSSWLSGVRYGNLALVNERGKFVRAESGKKLPPEFVRLARIYELDPHRLAIPGYGRLSHRGDLARDDYETAGEAGARAQLSFEWHLRRRHRNEARVYLAVSTPNAYSWAERGWQAGNPFKEN